MATAELSDFRDGLPFLGGALWIDLLNTTPVIDGQPLDLIGGTEALALWSHHAGLAPAGAPAAQEVAEAQTLRAALRPVFDDLALGHPVSGAAREAVNAVLRHVTVTRQLTEEDGPPRLIEQEICSTGPAAAAAALDFARFVADFEPARLRHCSNPACTMVFYDRGKNNRRRWCSMQACGNRSKVASYRERKAARDGG